MAPPANVTRLVPLPNAVLLATAKVLPLKFGSTAIPPLMLLFPANVKVPPVFTMLPALPLIGPVTVVAPGPLNVNWLPLVLMPPARMNWSTGEVELALIVALPLIVIAPAYVMMPPAASTMQALLTLAVGMFA